MQPVVERPALPTEIRALVQQLQVVLQQYGYRLNRMLPADGSEAITLSDFADDAAAAAGGIEISYPYRTGSVQKVRVA